MFKWTILLSIVGGGKRVCNLELFAEKLKVFNTGKVKTS